MKSKLVKTITLFSALALFSGCASIMGTKTQKVTFDTNPKGAEVFLKDKMTCKTPCTVELVKDTYTSVTFKKDGYETRTVEIEQGIANIFWGNILVGGVLGSTTDSSSSAMYEYKPDRYFIELKENNL
jgi:hypothetical protein